MTLDSIHNVLDKHLEVSKVWEGLHSTATVHWLTHHLPTPLVPGDWFFGHFLLRLSRIKRPQVMSMPKFSPTALNVDYDFVLLVHFFGTPHMYNEHCTYFATLVIFNFMESYLQKQLTDSAHRWSVEWRWDSVNDVNNVNCDMKSICNSCFQSIVCPLRESMDNTAADKRSWKPSHLSTVWTFHHFLRFKNQCLYEYDQFKQMHRPLDAHR